MGKRGPRKSPGTRERNGRLSRVPSIERQRKLDGLDQEQREMLSVGLTAREHIWGVQPKHSRDQKAGSAIGRMCLHGHITQPQYDAAMMFLESYNRHLLAIDAPKPQPGAIDLNAAHGRPVAVENAGLMRIWRDKHAAAMSAITEKQLEIGLRGNLYGALYAVLVRDVELDQLLCDLRTALNALVRHYKLEAREAA